MRMVHKSMVEIQSKLVGYAPDRCRPNGNPCDRVAAAVGFGAIKVANGEASIEEVGGEIMADCNNGCRYGAEDTGGCFGGSRCGYGTLCRFPDNGQTTFLQISGGHDTISS